jgi:hypothetical protein
MRTATDALSASLRGREGRLRVRRVGDSERRFVVRLPRRFGKRPVLDLFARYPQGDGFFGARLRLQPARPAGVLLSSGVYRHPNPAIRR